MPIQGGMKGCMVPGDAHPYLAPYNEYDKKTGYSQSFSFADSDYDTQLHDHERRITQLKHA